jgi:hypothetical protein
VRRFHRLALRTEEAYLQWIKRFLVFCRDHPHLTPALSPPSEGAERENYSPTFGMSGEGVCRTVIQKIGNCRLLFPLPSDGRGSG